MNKLAPGKIQGLRLTASKIKVIGYRDLPLVGAQRLTASKVKTVSRLRFPPTRCAQRLTASKVKTVHQKAPTRAGAQRLTASKVKTVVLLSQLSNNESAQCLTALL